ncbi:MAG: biotin/lipoyl-binding protein, partial [Polyangiaceae bacterium]
MQRASAALALTLATLLPACAKTGHVPLTEAAPIAVEMTTAHEEALPIIYRTSGTVRGRNTAILTSKTSGYVRAVHVRPGDRVTLGQPLVDLEANDVRAGVTQARAGLDQAVESKAEAENALDAARANAALAKSSYERVKKLFDERAIPE